MVFRKFTPPVISRQWLRRKRLTDALAAGQGLVFVSAPAGSGKTVAVAQWLSEQRNKTAWISLDRYDNEPAVFYAGLIGAMAQAQKANRTLRCLAERAISAPDALNFFLKAMDRVLDNEKSYVLVLDDFHVIDNPEILAALPRVIARFPNNFTLAVLSRSRAPEPFASHIAKNQVLFLSAADLRFTPGEVGRLSRLLRRDLDAEAVGGLCREAGGWAIGIRLLSAREGDEPA